MNRLQDFAAEGIDTKVLRARGPLLIVVWRTGCSTCRYAMPHYQRLHEMYPEAAVVGVSQDDSKTTKAYCRENGLTFPQVTNGLEVSRLFKPQTVPKYVLVGQEGEILLEGEAWNLDDLNLVGKRFGEFVGHNRGSVVSSGQDVVRFKPG